MLSESDEKQLVEVPPPESGRPAASEVTLREADEKQFAEVLHQYRGKVVLVDCWATWCGPCVKLFAHTVQLHQRHAEEGLVVISVSFDEPEDKQRVLDFLKSKKATFDNFIYPHGLGPKAMKAFDVPAGLPHLKLYDRHGNLYKTFGAEQSAAIDEKQIDQAVEELLAQEPKPE